MKSLSRPFSPTSLQLRFSLKCRKSPPVFLRMRFSPFDRRFDLGVSASEVAGSERKEPPHPFARLYAAEGGGGCESAEKGRSGGMLGAALAGLLFAAGVMFAILSLNNRNGVGSKRKIEPLTMEQKMLLNSNDTKGNIDQLPPEKVLVPVSVEQVQGQALAALQFLKVIEADIQPGDICSRREYARWLVSSSNNLSRNTGSKVYPAMYIENVTALAFDDVTPEDPDFPYIQGLAEAGLISSKLSRTDLDHLVGDQEDYVLFSPESPVSRQDLISWKKALETRQLPQVDRNDLCQCSGYIDINKINPDAWPALVADLSAGKQGITALAFGCKRLFQPEKPVTKAQAAIALATGDAAEVISEELACIEAESLAETAVSAHATLVAEVEKDLNANFEEELSKERENIKALEKLAEEAKLELEKLRNEREEEHNALIKGHAAVKSEMEVLSRLRHEVEEQLQSFITNRLEISFERDRIEKLQKEAECQNQDIVQLQYELEAERKALSMARTWADEEAERVREQVKAFEEVREQRKGHGIKVFDGDFQGDASVGTAGEQPPVDKTIQRGEILVKKLKTVTSELRVRSAAVLEKIIEKIISLISILKQRALEASRHAIKFRDDLIYKAESSVDQFKESASGFSSVVEKKTRRMVEDCKEGVDKITQKFKTREG